MTLLVLLALVLPVVCLYVWWGERPAAHERLTARQLDGVMRRELERKAPR
jgi:glucose-6-phosphate dehydrogenase assembly protein OpcA